MREQFGGPEGLQAAGAIVTVASRKADACAATEAHLKAMGGDVLGVPTHMGDIGSINEPGRPHRRPLRTTRHRVNNAANALALPFGQLTEEAWAKSLDTNLRGPVFLVERALPHLEATGNALILNVISAGAFLFSRHAAMYAAAKAGLMAMTRSMAADFAERGIRVNARAPGTVDTDTPRTEPARVRSLSVACGAAFVGSAARVMPWPKRAAMSAQHFLVRGSMPTASITPRPTSAAHE